MAAYQYIYVMKGLGKTYPGGREVLRDIWLSFLPGAKIGVLGLNGAGKSTLLRIMAGQERDFSGEAWAAEGASVGFLPQEPALDPSKDVAGNVMEGLAETKALLDRFEAVSTRFADELSEEAITHCTRALEVLGTKPAGTERDRQELELLVALGVPTFAARGYMSADVERIYGRARDLCDAVTYTPHRFTVLRGLWNSAFMRKPLALSQNLGAELLALANAEDDDTRRALACRAHGCSLFFRGEFELAWQRFREAVDRWPLGKARAEFLVYGEDSSVLCRAYGSWLLWFLGYPDESDMWIDQALADAQALAQPFICAMTLGLASALHVHRGEVLQALERAEASWTLSTKHGFPQWTAYAQMCRGWARTALGEADAGIAEMEQGWTDWQALGSQLATVHATVRLAEACAKTARIAAGLDWIDVAEEHARMFQECFLEAELHRIRGELLLGREAPLEAEACLRRAMEIARHQKAKSLELRAAMVLAQLWQCQGRRQEAYDLVAPIFGWFTQGFDTPDLKKARALLDELARA
jgi:predicted ATPase